MLDMSLSIQDLEYFLLVFTRITCFFVSAPFFSTANVPYRAKVGIGFFTAMLVYQFVVPHEALVYNTVIGYAILVFKEAIVGLVIGLGANLPLAILTFSGKIMDMEVGLSMVNIYDPTTRVSEGFSGMFYHYMVLLILILSDMHHYLIKALVEAFTLIPTGHVTINADRLYASSLVFLADYISIGFRICLPIFAAILMVNVVLGVMAKTAPQMNMFSVGMQIKILMGLGIMFVTVALIPGASAFIYTEIKRMVVMMTQVFY